MHSTVLAKQTARAAFTSSVQRLSPDHIHVSHSTIILTKSGNPVMCTLAVGSSGGKKGKWGKGMGVTPFSHTLTCLFYLASYLVKDLL